MPAISPSNIEEWQRNAYYKTQEEYPLAIAEAMREEYKAIVDAGFLLQIDDPRLVSYYLVSARRQHRRVPQMGADRASRRSTTRCAASRRRKSATTPATASTWARACTTWRSSTSSTHPEDQRRRLFVRGGEPAPRARMENLGECQAAEGQGADPGRDQPFDRAGRASGAGGRAHRAVRQAGRAGARDRRLRLRLRHLRGQRRRSTRASSGRSCRR